MRFQRRLHRRRRRFDDRCSDRGDYGDDDGASCDSSTHNGATHDRTTHDRTTHDRTTHDRTPTASCRGLDA